jgi:hypothetical protein
MGQKTLFSKKSKRDYKRLIFLYVLDKSLLNGFKQASCQVLNWSQWKFKYKCNVHGCHGNKNTELDKSAIQAQQRKIFPIFVL